MGNGSRKTDFGVVHQPSVEREIPREVKLQEWEGQVQEVGSNYFSARLVDLTASENEETEEAELPLDDLIESDRALLVPGAVFRWIIGYRYMYGQKERFTRVVIRRLPMWTEQEIRSADREAADLYEALSAARTAADKMHSGATDLTGRGTVLLVENEEEERARNARELESTGYTVIEADSDIGKALEELKMRGDHVDVVITDLVMPEMDGLALIELLKELDINIKVIFLSASEGALDSNLADGKRFNFLAKPFTPKELAAVVKETIGG
jgi:CheY-like chemotaxis protein